MSLKKKILYSFLSLNLFSTLCYAHGAHEHGTAKVDIGFDGPIIHVNLFVPSMSIYGFEHEAKTEKEKSDVTIAMNKLKNNIHKMVIFPTSLKCKMNTYKMDNFVKEDDDEPESILVGAEHGNVKASFSFQCNKTLATNLIKFSFQSSFPAIHKLIVQVVGDNVQKGAVIESAKGELQL